MALLPAIIAISVLAAVAAGGLWTRQNGRSSRSLAIGLLLFFVSLGFGRMKMEQRPPDADGYLAAARGKQVEVLGTVGAIAEKESFFALTLSDVRMIWEGEELPIPGLLLYIEKEEFQQSEERHTLRLGMEVCAKGKPEQPAGPRNPGEFDFGTYYKALGISYQMFGSKLEVTDFDHIPYLDAIYRLRLAAGKQLTQICEPEDLGIFQAAILGDKGSLDEEIRGLYQRNGIAHLLAISGLHISLVGLGVYRMLRRAGLGYGAAGLAGLVLIVSYGILTGASASVIRAVTMVLLYMLAEYLGRSYDMLSAAACIGTLLLMESPYLLFQSGFQLSFGAVAAIGGLGPWLVREMAPGPLTKPLFAGLSIQLVTYPILLYHFFEYPIYGIFLNLLVIPLMTYVIISGIAGLFLSLISLELGRAALGTGHYILKFYVWICRQCDKIPGSNLIIGRPGLWQIGIYILILMVFLWYVSRVSGEHQVRRRCTMLTAVLCSFFLLWRPPVRIPEVTFLDVGQGDGICIQTRNGVILVDGGSSSNKRVGESSMEPFLKSRGISRIDYAIVSHGDADHISGLQYLLEQEQGIRIDNLILPWLGQEGGDDIYQTLAGMMERHGGKTHWMKAGQRLLVDDLTLTCLYHGDEKKREEKNEHSLMLRLDHETARILLTGDMSSDGERDALELLGPVNVLKVAHHGSKYSTSQEFLSVTKPALAVISCGEGNSYGHPHPEVLERLSEAQAELLVTQDTGAITLYLDQGTMTYSTFLKGN